MRLRSIVVDRCLQGGDGGISVRQFARLANDPLRSSRHVRDWPHVKLLQQHEKIGDRLWDPDIFERTEYYRNACLSMTLTGTYFEAQTKSEICLVARRFVNRFLGENRLVSRQDRREDTYGGHIAVHPISHSNCYQVIDGHHRIAISYVRGIREVPAIVEPPEVTTELQDLLLDVLWLRGRRELYQPVDSPELKDGWVLVRRCSDRFAKMIRFLQAESLMPPVTTSYLDIASSYGWFVSEMGKAGFQAYGVDQDSIAASVGTLVYGLGSDQFCQSDAAAFLRAARRTYSVTSCFSLLHHYLVRRRDVTAEELLRLIDAATDRVLFFDMGQSHEAFLPTTYVGWDADSIAKWLKSNTTFRRIIPLGTDEDAVPPFQDSYGRMMFACVR
jgi:hypothetical protein